MIELVICGRGGQGTMITAEILARALLLEGRHVQAFPSFYPEKRGAPSSSFVRYSSEEILLRCEIYEPDYLIILDSSIFPATGWERRLRPSTRIIANSRNGNLGFPKSDGKPIVSVDVTKIVMAHKLGGVLNPIVSAAILGVFAASSQAISLQSLEMAISQSSIDQKPQHLAAVRETYEQSAPGAA